MHLVGFTIEICYDARPYERQAIPTLILKTELLHEMNFRIGSFLLVL